MSKVDKLANDLINSHWPKCNSIAEELFSIGTEDAKKALLQGLNSKRHHARTASIRSLVKFEDDSIVESLERLLEDPAYETRTEAKNAIDALKKK